MTSHLTPSRDPDAATDPLLSGLGAPSRYAAARVNASTPTGPVPPGRIEDAVTRRALEHPDELALVDGDVELSRRALDELTEKIATDLDGKGIGAGDLVAVVGDRGAAQTVCVLAVLRAGAAWLPVSRSLPEARVQAQFDAARPDAVVEVGEGPWDPVTVTGRSVRGGGSGGQVEGLAYVFPTSGSTGVPKAVAMGHTQALTSVAETVRLAGIGPGDRILAVSPTSFDLSVWDLLASLLSGAALVMVPPADERDPGAIARLVDRRRVSVVMAAPALLALVLSAAELTGRVHASLRAALCGGDWIPGSLVRTFHEVAGADPRFFSIGGSTECSPVTMWHRVGPEEVVSESTRVPYGRPLAGQRVYVVDEESAVVPVDVPGELLVAGSGVGPGYLHDPVRDGHAFFRHPVSGERMYRTGDRAVYTRDGLIELRGRIDQQVKVRGHRIEMGDVESALSALPEVGAAAVVAEVGDDGQVADLVAHVASESATPAGIASALASTLPDYMIPGRVVVHRQLPLTANGKVDRRALTAAPRVSAAPGVEERRDDDDDDLVDSVRRLWEHSTGRAPAPVDVPFLDLGGDSLSAARLVFLLRRELGTEIDMAALPSMSVRDVAAAVGACPRTADGARPGPVSGSGARLVHDAGARYEPFPLTDQQQAYVVGRDPSLPLGNIACHVYLELDTVAGSGDTLDVAALDRAWQRVIGRHDALRLVIDPQTMTQRVSETVPRNPIRVIPDEPGAAGRIRDELSHSVRDVGTWPLFEVVALPLAAGGVRLCLSLDSLIADFRGLRIILEDWAAYYENPDTELPPPEITYRDYVLRALDVEREAADTGGTRYWRERLPTLPSYPELPLSLDPETVITPHFSTLDAVVEPGRWATFTRLCRQNRVTTTAAVFAAYAWALACWSSNDHFLLNVPSFNRLPLHPRVDDIVGEFATFTLLEVDVSDVPDFRTFARAVQSRLWRDIGEGRLSGVRVLREIVAARGSFDGPVAPVVATSEVAIAGGDEPLLGGRVEETFAVTQTPQVWMDLRFEERDGALRLHLDHLRDVIDPAVAQGIFDTVLACIDRAVSPDRADWGTWLPPRPAGTEVHGQPLTCRPVSHAEMFLDRVREDPDAPALVDADLVLSRGDLLARAGSIADALTRRGVSTGDVVAVAVPRGWRQYAALLGVTLAGGTYSPVDVDQPTARATGILDTLRPALVLTHDADFSFSGVRARVDDLLAEGRWAGEPAPAASIAYILFTSGSTGRPKGVRIGTEGLAVCVDATITEFGLGPHTVSLAVSRVHHDMSVFDVAVTLAAGGRIVVPSDLNGPDPQEWLELIRRERVTALCAVPGLVDMLLTADRRSTSTLSSLELVLTGGARVAAALVTELRGRAPACTVVSVGGPTETTAWNIWFPIRPDEPVPDPVPYGRPIRATTYRVADRDGLARPVGAVGELLVSGPGVTPGFVGGGQVDRFHHEDGTVWIRTGDRGVLHTDGLLRFVGRVDEQVQIRGHRVEPGEVESVLVAHPAIRSAVVTPRFREDAGDPRDLVAHVVMEAGGPAPVPAAPVTERDLVEFARRHLPDHMVPARIEILDRLPLTPNGKVDRDALRLTEQVPTSPDVGPTGDLERIVLQSWSETLGVDCSSVHENFFDLGGDSIRAAAIVVELRELFATPIPITAPFRNPSVGQLCSALRRDEPRPGHFDAVAAVIAEVRAMDETMLDHQLDAGGGL